MVKITSETKNTVYISITIGCSLSKSKPYILIKKIIDEENLTVDVLSW